MNKKITAVWLLLFITLTGTQTTYASSNCTFDDNYYSKETYSNKSKLNLISWNNKTKKAKIVTDSGELISIKHWSCNHIGLHAVMLVGPYSDNNFENLKDYVLSLASIALDATEYKTVTNKIKSMPIEVSSIPHTINFNKDEYSEFYLKYALVNESMIIEIKFYRN